ncbi:hypothetical protein BIV60_09405 [Bacillus sp. MUM 116]|uniref:hypothetical protein n=1 Tax=Bacillus sp. MUM 116 TaxID=1678002 RepID=UPI0008F5F0F4|nr:hypothetical protein [Bacillus sp. MUM 116]OIK15474.1 hypothetical protein BIV60_09405 [Bacillus sp. MUM 116]
MKRIKELIFMGIFIGSLIIPTSALASSNTSQSSSYTGINQFISDLFSFFNKDSLGTVQNTSKNNVPNNQASDDWWDCFLKWLCNEEKHDGKDDDQCKDKKGKWGNEDGCLSSAEIWKRWYCN